MWNEISKKRYEQINEMYKKKITFPISHLENYRDEALKSFILKTINEPASTQ